MVKDIISHQVLPLMALIDNAHLLQLTPHKLVQPTLNKHLLVPLLHAQQDRMAQFF